jgi:hypothetical protein
LSEMADGDPVTPTSPVKNGNRCRFLLQCTSLPTPPIGDRRRRHQLAVVGDKERVAWAPRCCPGHSWAPRSKRHGYSGGDQTPKVSSVKVCPHCAEELPDEATVCSICRKDPALAPARKAPERPDETSLRRLGDAFGSDGILPTSERVPAPFKDPETSWASGIPSKVWISLALALAWGLASGVAGLASPALPWGTRLILQAAGFIAGLILGIWGRAEVPAWDRLGQILGNIAIGLNGFRLAWIVLWALQAGLVVRG